MEHYHFIGIGGIGMSALARILLKKNVKVTGTDQSPNKMIETLVREGASVDIGHSKDKIVSGATVVYSSAIKPDNPERQVAKEFHCPMLHRSELLARLTKGFHTLAVTGSHGKTTTSSLLASVLKKADLDPAYALGGILLEYGSNGDGGAGDYFVLEADESDGSFLNYDVYGGIVTNIDHDHLDHYGTIEALKEAMFTFMSNVANPDLLFWCGDDEALSKMNMKGVSYGFGDHCDWQAMNFQQQGWVGTFDARHDGQVFPRVEVALSGRHQALNALAVFGLCTQLQIPENVIRHALKTFGGVGRRCEKKNACDSESNGILIIDDYAHHPTEVATTLKAIREAIGDRRLVAAFQPHRYSRTQACLKEYADVFDPADLLFITDIYAGPGEVPIPGVSADAIVQKVKEHGGVEVRYFPRHNLGEAVLQELRPGDVLVTMSAGDLPKLAEELAIKIMHQCCE